MTALAGLWRRSADAREPADAFTADAPTADVARMLAAQAAYGPEPAVLATSGAVTLGRRLYPLLPEDDHDRGPVRGGDGTLLLVADARIDNREDLGARIGLSPAALARMSEVAVLMALIERDGVAGLAHAVGGWALALWDARRSTLTLARDAMGERPLHYHIDARRGDIAIASMPKGLHALPHVPYAADAATAADFLAVLPEGEASFFAGIARVPAGHAVTFTPDGTPDGARSATRLWSPDPRALRLSADAYAEGLRFELDRAVACRLRRAGGGVAAHLSAGLDSGIVAATAARALVPDTLDAFTAVPGRHAPVPAGAIPDEGALAASVARLHPNIRHHLIRGTGASPLPLLDRHFDLYQRPIMNPSNAVWGEAINDAARAAGARVLLTGQLGNLTLTHDGMQRLPELLRAGRLVALARLAGQLHARGRRWRGLAATTIGPFLPAGLWAWAGTRYGRSYALSGYSALRAQALDAHDTLGRAAGRGTDLSYRPWADGRAMRWWGLGRVDMGLYTKGTLAGWGLAMSDPTADRRLVEFTLRVPEAAYIRGGQPRALARRAFADRLSPEVVGEARRGFQAADWHVGLAAARGDIAAELDAFTRCAEADALVDVARLRALLDDWPDYPDDDPRWNGDVANDRYRSMLLRGVATGHFLRRVARSN